jgi:hypothetical protein
MQELTTKESGDDEERKTSSDTGMATFTWECFLDSMMLEKCCLFSEEISCKMKSDH